MIGNTNDNPQLDFGPQQMTNDQVWDVATVNWPAHEVTSIDTVRDRRPGEGFPGKPQRLAPGTDVLGQRMAVNE